MSLHDPNVVNPEQKKRVATRTGTRQVTRIQGTEDVMARGSIFDAAGGAPAFEALTRRFYEKVRVDPALRAVFATFTAEHASHVALWLGEVFGGPPHYSQEHGGHRTILERHRGLGLTEGQKDRWVELMLETAREILPNDSELQLRFADYIRWGAGIALTASQPGFEIRHVGPVPKWEWNVEHGS